MRQKGICYIATVSLAAIPIMGYQLFIAIAAIIMASNFYHKPQLFFLFEFKALRLIVVNESSGVPLFSYSWKTGEDMVNEVVYAGLIQGIRAILTESIGRGKLSEMKLTNANVILESNPDFKLFCFLAVTKSSETLRYALKLFTQRFVKEFSKKINKTDDISKFDSAAQFIHECFPFLPE